MFQKFISRILFRCIVFIIIVYAFVFSYQTISVDDTDVPMISEPNKHWRTLFQINQNISNKSKLRIVIPFHFKQLDRVLENIKKWKIFKPCDKSSDNISKIELIYYVGYSKSDENILNDLYKKLPSTLDCFSLSHIVLFKYNSSDEDQHVKGARLMFEHMLKKKDVPFKDTSFVFYMEPDVRPIKSNWLNGLVREIGNENFWMKGSCFRGDLNKFMKNDPYTPNYMHINGNALYKIGSKDFNHFYFNVLRPYVIKKNGDSKNAYDTDFFEFFFDKENYEKTRSVIGNFHFSDFVQNFWQTSFKVNEIALKFANTFFIHGGFPEY